MLDRTKALREYAKAISANLSRGDATELTHRSALEALLRNWPAAVATNEPRKIACGAPDLKVSAGSLTVGYVETKDIGENLTKAERTKQVKGYLEALPNFVLTDYIEFRWYTDGQLRETARLGMVGADGTVKTTKSSLEQVQSLLDKFMEHTVPSAGTAKELAVRMAHLARMIRDVTAKTFAQEEQTGTLHGQYQAFKEVLLPELTPDDFADMFAQTVAYGLFAARESARPGEEFTRQNAAYMLPKTNPFLRKLFGHIAGPELDDRIAWIVDDLAQVLDTADMANILEDFCRRTREEDPVVHFYETFLKEYNPKERKLRGVYYTPEPVVSYIVRSVDYLLRTKFDKPLGLADPNVLILDPACGTGTFLFYVVKLIHQRMIEQGQQGGWNDYVEKHLLPRLFGFELLVAPYAIAHLKLGLLLEETGYEFKSDQRLEIYLTNSLEEAVKSEHILPLGGFITEEANAAAEIKREKPIMVVLGNPPYSVQSDNRRPWIEALMDEYKRTVRQEETQIQALSNDYIKFIRFAQWRIQLTGHGIVAMITNNGYLSGPLARDMRESLLDTFSDVHLLNLHGSARWGETVATENKDENVFDIQQGVAIALLVRQPTGGGTREVYYADLFGTRRAKYEFLNENWVETTPWQLAYPSPPLYLVTPTSHSGRQEYEAGLSLLNIFGTGRPDVDRHVAYGVGFATQQDKFAISFSEAEVEKKIGVLTDDSLSEADVRSRFRLCTTIQWEFARARSNLKRESWQPHIQWVLYRPFDWRVTAYIQDVVSIPRMAIMRHLLDPTSRPNIALVTGRIINAEQPRHDFVSCYPVEKICLSSTTSNNAFVFPLYLYPGDGRERDKQETLLHADQWPAGLGGRRPNVNPGFVAEMEKRLGMRFVSDGKGDLADTFGPEDVFHYIYAVLHSPTYRTRYAEFLKLDFPRVPLTSEKGLFRRLAEKGAELVSLHLMESPALSNLITKFTITGSDEVEKVRYDEARRRVYINRDQYFEGVEPGVWEFHVGGYQVLEKWLKDRKGRKLTWDDQQHYQKVVVALKQSIRLMREIDGIIPSWPIE
ncbi:MAG TPA: type ISP restriction/modification enzyme [Armatimonadota bacterium]|nr:type ISP restriction/modification enzyme [Armatimonadota bacterium]